MTNPIGPVDATKVPRYTGPATFARLPRTDEVTHTDVAVVGLAKVLTGAFFHDGAWSSFRRRHHGRPILPRSPCASPHR